MTLEDVNLPKRMNPDRKDSKFTLLFAKRVEQLANAPRAQHIHPSTPSRLQALATPRAGTHRCASCTEVFCSPDRKGVAMCLHMCWRCGHSVCYRCRRASQHTGAERVGSSCVRRMNFMHFFESTVYGPSALQWVIMFSDEQSRRHIKYIFRMAAPRNSNEQQQQQQQRRRQQQQREQQFTPLRGIPLREGDGTTNPKTHTELHIRTSAQTSACVPSRVAARGASVVDHQCRSPSTAMPLRAARCQPALRRPLVSLQAPHAQPLMRVPATARHAPPRRSLAVERKAAGHTVLAASRGAPGPPAPGAQPAAATARGAPREPAAPALFAEVSLSAPSDASGGRLSPLPGRGREHSVPGGFRLDGALLLGADAETQRMSRTSAPQRLGSSCASLSLSVSPSRSESPPPRFPSFSRFLDEQKVAAPAPARPRTPSGGEVVELGRAGALASESPVAPPPRAEEKDEERPAHSKAAEAGNDTEMPAEDGAKAGTAPRMKPLPRLRFGLLSSSPPSQRRGFALSGSRGTKEVSTAPRTSGSRPAPRIVIPCAARQTARPSTSSSSLTARASKWSARFLTAVEQPRTARSVASGMPRLMYGGTQCTPLSYKSPHARRSEMGLRRLETAPTRSRSNPSTRTGQATPRTARGPRAPLQRIASTPLLPAKEEGGVKRYLPLEPVENLVPQRVLFHYARQNRGVQNKKQ